MTDDFVKKKNLPKKEYNVVLMIANTAFLQEKNFNLVLKTN